ncbi:NAC transcription factor 47-like [Mangifera indica]|uniref:NAC transcription factor 47-like n=1 Tax=Mangifera indica TaxID=29780 RepID=UPI001CFADC97|nr:NAC transcription factor 47-like [Mangifera indica]
MVYIKNHPQSTLPPGFRFHPTDEELILHYLKKKVASIPFSVSIIADVDIYKFDPWDLPAKAAFGEKEWYFFSPRDRKYPNGARPNRAAASGYWKATGTDKIILTSAPALGGRAQENIGVKKALVFYQGRPPKGVKTNWIMHEYRLADSPNSLNYNKPMKSRDYSMRLDDWVLCRIYQKSQPSSPTSNAAASDQEEEQCIQDTLLPFLTSPPNHSTLRSQKSSSFSNLFDALDMDYSMLSSLLAENQMNQTGLESNPLFTSGVLDQPVFYNGTSSSGNNSSYFLEKPPPLNSSAPNLESKLKRPHSNMDDTMLQHPSKKFINSCSFTKTTDQTDPQYNFLHQPFLNQQLLLSPHLQFQG